MARDFYETTIALPDATTGALHALADINVSVVPRGVQVAPNTVVDIFVDEVGVTRASPYTTDASGQVRFWAEAPAEYDIVFEDSQAPARIDDRISWNAVAVAAGSVPISVLSAEGGITQAMLAPEVVNQQVPIGGVIEWWRPQQSVAPPAGFEIADGRSVPHEFPGIVGNVALPNLQNVFIIGATTTKTDGTGADANDTPGGAPGVRGSGGSNAPKNFAHGHGVPGVDHVHDAAPLWVTGHGHHLAIFSGNESAGTWPVKTELTYPHPVSVSTHGHGIEGDTWAIGNQQVNGTTGASDRPLHTATNSTSWTADPGTEFRPRFIGLLRLIKVRRS